MSETSKDPKLQFYLHEIHNNGYFQLLFFMDILGKQGEYSERAAAVRAIRHYNREMKMNIPTIKNADWYPMQVGTVIEAAAIDLMERVNEFNSQKP